MTRSHACVHARAGAALILALLLLVILDCIVVGTLQLAILERGLATNSAAALRLRLAADAAVQVALAAQAGAMDSLPVAGPLRRVDVPASPDGIEARVTIERIAPDLYLLRAVASERPPRMGRAVATLLASPPPLAAKLAVTHAAAATYGGARIHSGGAVRALSTGDCERQRAPVALAVPSLDRMVLGAGARIEGPLEQLGPAPDPTHDLLRLEAYARTHAGEGLRLFERDTSVVLTGRGVVVAGADLGVLAGSTFRGIIVARGRLSVHAGAVIAGAVLGVAALDVGGEVSLDRCEAHDAIERSALRRAGPAGDRVRLPAF